MTLMHAKKSLGQNFLRCEWVVDTLIRAAHLTREDTVLEIGPGTGVLTRALAAAAGKVVAVEKDGQLVSELRMALEKEGIGNVNIREGDILSLLKSLLKSDFNRRGCDKVVANIPYYITGQLLRLLFECDPLPRSIILTLQKEVAERIIAKPPHMNMLALSVAAFGTPEIIALVPASCFSPQPKVDSAILKISDISRDFFINKIEKAVFFETARAGFSQKRKMLINSLAVFAGGDKVEIVRALEKVGLTPRARPEELSLRQWTDLIAALRK